MLKRFIAVFTILTILTVSLCACGGDKEISLVVPIAKDPMCLDPQVADSDSAKLIINNCYEGLVRLDDQYAIVPGVAEQWDISADGLTYTFHLRTDSNWQLLKTYADVLEDEDYMTNFKTTVTAYDFQFAFQRALDPQTKAGDAEKLFCIKNAKAIYNSKSEPSTIGVKATDSSTLVITLERANKDFLRLLTLPICMPCNEEFFNATHAKYGLQLKYTFCNGPFYLGKWTEDNTLTVYRNEGYKGNATVNPVAVYFSINKDEESIIKRVKQNTYDTAFISYDYHLNLESNKKITQLSVSNSVTGLCFNCNDEVLSNINLRKALVTMTEFDKISMPMTATDKAKGVVPDCVRYGEYKYRDVAGEISIPTYNESAALSLWTKGLKELDYENATITILCTEDYAQQMQQTIQNWQRLLGTAIIAKVQVLTKSEIDKAISDDSYQIAVSSIKVKSSSVTDTLKMFTSESEDNIFNYSNNNYDKTVESIIKTYNGNGIVSGCQSAEAMLVDNAVFCPLFTESEYMAVAGGVTGIFTAPAFESVCYINGGRN